MRIAYMLTSLGIGGAERQVTSIAERMALRGHDVVLVVVSAPAAAQCGTSNEVVYLNVRRNPLSAAAGYLRALRILHEFQPDILHCHNFHGNLFGRLLRVAVRARVISTIHNEYEGGWARMGAYRFTWMLSDRTIAVSERVALEAARRGAVHHRDCAVIANGIDPAEFAPRAERRREMRSELGAGNNFIWMTTGRITEAKDYETLLRAFARLHAAESGVGLWVAGEGSGDYARQMRALSESMGLRDSVRWLGLRSDIPGLLDAADAFVLASAWEGMPLALGEAMAMEKPVIATDVGGVAEMVGDCGAIVPAQNPARLAEGMRAYMRMPCEARRALGRKARARISEKFSMDAKADAWEALYRSTLPAR